jgi:hypothetical protein
VADKPKSRAGEGGGLPKGLSLFRFILFSSLMTGAVYGGASLYYNAPPPPGDRPPGGTPSAEWAPSPLLLPSFITIKFGIGVRHTPTGYVVTGRLGNALYASTSIFIGIIIVGAIGWFAGEAVRRWAVRKRYE